MKKTCTTLLLILTIAATANAQIAIEGGVNMANLAIKDAGTKIKTKFLASEAAGLVADMRLANHIYFEPGLFYKGEGCIIQSPKSYVIFPAGNINLNVEYKSGDKCGSRFMAGLGPFIGINEYGNYADGYANSYLKQLDLGLAANIGYLLHKHYYLRASYQYGLQNLLINGDSKNSIKTSAIGITFGFLFINCRPAGLWGGRMRQGHHWRGLRNNGPYRKERNYNRNWLGY